MGLASVMHDATLGKKKSRYKTYTLKTGNAISSQAVDEKYDEMMNSLSDHFANVLEGDSLLKMFITISNLYYISFLYFLPPLLIYILNYTFFQLSHQTMTQTCLMK